ncbi:hypothetical protein QMZ65_03220 [Pantoea sp. EABMAA-21]|uniref:hypothetical protein n=1 Tax=Pantoea sp. EABMAA-21 TaxID=3043302 RepID=UPI0024B54924|nr:hypothetical protein [Pantoea sp. EABMAA-21]MDI9276216.1 hypothetical protein [Pantoea sp. EABMAA-21]
MKNQEFEPGPWILGGCSGRMITTPDGYVGDGFIADVDTLANARLIAAAPELLEALKAMLNKAYKQNWNDQYPDEIEAAQNAISKALGQ